MPIHYDKIPMMDDIDDILPHLFHEPNFNEFNPANDNMQVVFCNVNL